MTSEQNLRNMETLENNFRVFHQKGRFWNKERQIPQPACQRLEDSLNSILHKGICFTMGEMETIRKAQNFLNAVQKDKATITDLEMRLFEDGIRMTQRQISVIRNQIRKEQMKRTMLSATYRRR